MAEMNLRDALDRENERAELSIYNEQNVSAEFVGCYDRDDMARWLSRLTHDHHFRLEVCFRAVSLLDSFLSIMKVRHRFLKCVALTCFYIAAKLEEKAEALSSLTENAALRYGVECSEKDIQRMELIVMQKLDFRLYDITTPLDFLKMFHCIGTLSLPDGLSSDQHLIHVALCLEPIICDHAFMRYPPSRLALAALACDLKLIGCNWLDTVLALQALAKMRGGELSMCYEAIAARYASIAVCFPLVVMNSVPRHAPDQDDEEELLLLPSRPVELCCIRNIPAVKVMA